jgi:ferritin
MLIKLSQVYTSMSHLIIERVSSFMCSFLLSQTEFVSSLSEQILRELLNELVYLQIHHMVDLHVDGY